MPQYPVKAGCFIGGQRYAPGDVITLKAEDAAELIERGTLDAAKRGRPTGSSNSSDDESGASDKPNRQQRRSGWSKDEG